LSIGKVVGTWTVVDQRYNNLSSFQRNDLAIVGGANHRIVSFDLISVRMFITKELVAVTWSICEVLPWPPRNAIID